MLVRQTARRTRGRAVRFVAPNAGACQWLARVWAVVRATPRWLEPARFLGEVDPVDEHLAPRREARGVETESGMPRVVRLHEDVSRAVLVHSAQLPGDEGLPGAPLVACRATLIERGVPGAAAA